LKGLRSNERLNDPGVYVEVGDGRLEFLEASVPDEEMVFEVGRRVFTRLKRFLKREGYLDPTEGDAPEALDRWWMRATREPPVLPTRPRLVPASGSELPGDFSIHAGVRIEGDDRDGREQLLRYAARPAFSEVQLSLLEDDVVELELKSPTPSGQRVVHLHPVQFLRRLAWLIPPPGQNQVRYYGVFGPTHRLRAQVVPKPVELAVVEDDDADEGDGDGGADRYRVAWAKLLAKVFDVDAERCPACGGRLRPVGAVTRREEARAALAAGLSVLGARGPPTAA